MATRDARFGANMLDMHADSRGARRRPQPGKLPSCLAAALGLGMFQSLPATPVYVNTCIDLGTSSKGVVPLRYAVVHAVDGDTIDLSSLNCSTITLNSAQIPISVNNLTIQSSSSHPVTIDAVHASRVFDHTGTGTVSFRYLTIANGNAHAFPGSAAADDNIGGCIRTSGSMVLDHSTVSGGTALVGGGASVNSNLSLQYSVVTGNTANNVSTFYASGGGLAIGGTLTGYHSSISNNTSMRYAGGFYARGDIHLYYSIVSGNSGPESGSAFYAHASVYLEFDSVEHNSPGTAIFAKNNSTTTNTGFFLTDSTIASNQGGGLYVAGTVHASLVLVKSINSTISGNSFQGGIRGVYCSVDLKNTTIAFNDPFGVSVSTCSISIESSIISNSGTGSDLVATNSAFSQSNGHNLIQNALVVPGGTLQAEPRLTPLAYRGGWTRTHGLSASSPAIDAGILGIPLNFDQRFVGFARVVGASADIGSFERQANDDELFYGGFQ